MGSVLAGAAQLGFGVPTAMTSVPGSRCSPASSQPDVSVPGGRFEAGSATPSGGIAGDRPPAPAVPPSPLPPPPFPPAPTVAVAPPGVVSDEPPHAADPITRQAVRK